MDKTNFNSQAKQDKFIFEKILNKQQDHGFFVEIGAYDGIKFSNSYFFEKELNWKGVCVEPIKKYSENIKKNRACEVLTAAISDYDGETEFTHVENAPMFSGISENLEDDFSKKLSLNKKKIEKIPVKVVSFKSFLIKYDIKKITYLSMDTEGGEEIILKNIPFNKIKIDIISVEDNLNLKKVDKILEENNFILIKHAIFDKIFINKHSKYYNKKMIPQVIKANFLNFYINSKLDKLTRPILIRNSKLRTNLLKLINN